MTIKDLEAKISRMEKQIMELKDIEEIKNLQKAYGYYLDHFMSDEVVDCFSDSPGTLLDIYIGKFKGKNGVRKFLEGMLSKEERRSPELIHMVMQLAGIIHVDKDGKTAKGRWHGWGMIAMPRGGGIEQFFIHGIYEMTYVKEDGVWKIKVCQFNRIFFFKPGEGWVKQERVAAINQKKVAPFSPDTPRSHDPSYGTGYIVPFHFKHPVTGKATSEVKRNSSRKGQS
jgi:hypothetical protein